MGFGLAQRLRKKKMKRESCVLGFLILLIKIINLNFVVWLSICTYLIRRYDYGTNTFFNTYETNTLKKWCDDVSVRCYLSLF